MTLSNCFITVEHDMKGSYVNAMCSSNAMTCLHTDDFRRLVRSTCLIMSSCKIESALREDSFLLV